MTYTVYMTKPNILYIHSHDTGRYIQPYGFPVQTPHLQKLATEGVLFRQAFCVASSCSASRASLMSGMYPHQNGMTGLAHRGWYLNDYKKTLVSVLNDNGYHTALMGESHITPYDETDLIGYDEVVQDNSTPTSEMVEVAEEWFRNLPDKPWFLSCGFWDTHRTAYPEPDAEKAKYNSALPGFPDTHDLRKDASAFQSAVERLDAGMGRVFAALEHSGQADNTIIIATTDHAPGFPMYKANVSDKGLGVFLVMKAPGTRSGVVYEDLVTHLDIFPTICDLLGITQPDWLEGQSLIDVLEGSEQPLHNAVFGESNYHAAYEPQRSIRTSKYRYFERFDDRNEPVRPNIDDSESKKYWLEVHAKREKYNLFDLSLDPLELNNLAADPEHAGTKASLSSQLHQWQKQTDDPLLKGVIPHPASAVANQPDQASASDYTAPLPENS